MPRRCTRTEAFAAAWLILAAPGVFANQATPTAAADPDPFYTAALRQGETLYAGGDYAAAAKRLRIACFGLMNQPRLLGAALVRLALAEADAGDRTAFRATFDRIIEVEERFEGYSRAGLPSELRHALEARLVEWVPSEDLRAAGAFAQLVRNQELLRLQSLPAGQRRAELERLSRESPGDPSWGVMLAEAQVTSGDGALAIDSLESALAGGRRNVALECLLGRAYLQGARCDSALDRVPACDVRRLPTAELDQYLDCLTGVERWAEAAAVVVSLPPEARKARSTARREKEIARRVPPATGTRAPDALPLAEAVDTLRGELARANTVPLMRQVVAAARLLSERHPGAPEPLLLAGEAAYRLSDWRQAADLLAAGNPPDERPELLFYLSVSLYELGDLEGSARVLRRALPRLGRTEIVQRYIGLILGPDGPEDRR